MSPVFEPAARRSDGKRATDERARSSVAKRAGPGAKMGTAAADDARPAH